jgi:hypothetical protein
MPSRAYMLNRRVYYRDITNLMNFHRVPHRAHGVITLIVKRSFFDYRCCWARSAKWRVNVGYWNETGKGKAYN